MRFLLLTVLIAALTCSAAAQSRRVPSPPPGAVPSNSSADERAVKEMYGEVAAYLRAKAAELDAQKVRVSDARLAQLRLEQRQLAARYAATVSLRKGIAGEDLYYLGLLHYAAENHDGTRETLEEFVRTGAMPPDKLQTARSVLVVALAKTKELKGAETLLAEYMKNEPQRLTERASMAGELARAYKAGKDFEAMALHAEQGYSSSKKLLADSTSFARGLDEVLGAGLLLVSAQRGSSKHDAALATLDDMIAEAIKAQSPSFYYHAVDNKFRYLIDLGRKDDAKSFYTASVANALKNFTVKEQRDDAVKRLKRREKHYALLGLKAPAMPASEQWFPGKPRSLDDLKGKVVLIDFWATWCIPCLEAFPSLREWNEEFRGDGFEILGVTRYFGMVAGIPADKESELAYLKRFRAMHNLTYDLVVMDNQSMQLNYGSTALPTTVLIDRKGVVRYIETGTSTARLRDLREMIERLITEK